MLAIVALLAAVSLPRLPMATSRPQLEAYAVEVAALLKADRNAALGRRMSVNAVVDAWGRAVRSGSSPRFVGHSFGLYRLNELLEQEQDSGRVWASWSARS